MKKTSMNKTAEKILNSAEKLFAQYSYNEVSIRQITDDAEVKLVLVHYHFGSKEELYRELIKRRIGKLSSDRIKLLSNGLCSIEDSQEACQYLHNYITSGLKGILAKAPYSFAHSLTILQSQTHD